MRILFLTHGFNSLAQRLFIELEARGHRVTVEFDINDQVTVEGVALADPDLIIAPFLKRRIPEVVWRRHTCLIVHPGPVGERGPSSLDWAILTGAETWGVTVIEATADLDGGPVWAHAEFPMRAATKSSLYRHEVTEAAVEAVLEAVARFETYAGPLGKAKDLVDGPPIGWRPFIRQEARRIDWQNDPTVAVLRKIRASDGAPGVRDTLLGQDVRLFDAYEAQGFSGAPGAVIARSETAICRATSDGAVWIGQLCGGAQEQCLKRPAAHVLGDALNGVRLVDAEPVMRETSVPGLAPNPIRYSEHGEVGVLSFAFLNGAMGTAACRALLDAYRAALARPTKVLVLSGGPDFWSNGMDLNAIEAAESAADESWENINAIDDIAEAVIRTTDRFVVAAIAGNTGAGGVFLARAADQVWLREGVVLNPHYKDMGNLYGSEFWTYLLPRHVGAKNAARIVDARLPMGTDEALELGLADRVIAAKGAGFENGTLEAARALADAADLDARIAEKHALRTTHESEKPLSAYRDAELARMRMNFHGFDPSYHVARYNFVFKVPKSRTPITIARHRDKRRETGWRIAS